MSLLDGKDLLDYNQFFLSINLIKYRVTAGNVKPVDYNPAPQNQFFLIALASRERIFFQSFQGSFDYSPCFIRQAIDLIG
jgi:hypothetical protein